VAVSRDQNARRSHNIKNDVSSFERVKQFKYLGTILTRNYEQTEVREFLLSFGAEYFVFQFAVKKYKD
jgi:hypothetical protein